MKFIVLNRKALYGTTPHLRSFLSLKISQNHYSHLDFFLVPTSFGETYEQEVAPLATPKNELPDLQNWVKRFVISVIEIWSGRRTPLQVSRWCHRTIYQELLRKIGTFKSALYIRKIYLSEPIEGVGEVVVTLRIGERIRSLVIRIEGVDHRWICTELYLI